MPDHFVIRHATAADASPLAEFGARTFQQTFGAVNRAEDMAQYLERTYGETLQSREIADPRIITLLVEENQQLIGFAQMKIESAEKIELARFYVDPDRHGHGIAQRLMSASIDEAKRRGASTIWLGVWERNDRAIAFYKKSGFRDTGSHPFLVGSDLQTDRVMEREL